MLVLTTQGVCEIPDQQDQSISRVLADVMNEACRPADCCNAGTELVRWCGQRPRNFVCPLRVGDMIFFQGVWEITPRGFEERHPEYEAGFETGFFGDGADDCGDAD